MNVTPLVDVVLVLLIIFMVVAPQLGKDVPLNLPGVFNPDPEVAGNENPVTISVPRRGEYHVEEQQYDLNGVMQYLTVQHDYDPRRRLVLRADSKLPYSDVREFMDRVQQLGYPGLNFQVGEKHREGESEQPDQGNAPTPATGESTDAAPPAAAAGAS